MSIDRVSLPRSEKWRHGLEADMGLLHQSGAVPEGGLP